MPSPNSGIRLVTRGDDAGSFRAANLAIAEAFDRGIVRNASVMVPAPHFSHAAELFRARPGLCVGLHVTLNAEWEEPRWGPVLPARQVSSLVDREGHFFRTPLDLFERSVDLEQAMSEVKAQLSLARQEGLSIRYIDEHMGVGWIHSKASDQVRLRALLRKLADDEGLVWHETAPDLPALEQGSASSATVDPSQALLQRIDRAKPGVYVLILHPAHDSEETRGVQFADQPPGIMAMERARDFSLATSTELASALDTRGIVRIRYDEARDSRRHPPP